MNEDQYIGLGARPVRERAAELRADATALKLEAAAVRDRARLLRADLQQHQQSRRP